MHFWSLVLAALVELYVGLLELADASYLLSLLILVVLCELIHLAQLVANQIDTRVDGLAALLESLRNQHWSGQFEDLSVCTTTWLTFPEQVKLLLHQFVFVLLFDNAGAISH